MIDHSLFFNPDSQYRVKPFWFWNSKLERCELAEQIKDMHEKGIGGFFIHARFGLEIDYLSPEWFEAIRFCIQQAQRYGMEVWLYDENPFPSGIGGLKVSNEIKYRNRYIECLEYDLATGLNSIDIGKGEIVSAYLVYNDHFEPITVNSTDNNNICISYGGLSAGRLLLFIKRIIDNPNNKIFGIDYMNADAVRAFIEITHEQYARYLGEYFGNTIKGIFTDEPTLLPWHQDINWYIKRKDSRVVAWDDKIHEILCDRYGYTMDQLMLALFYGMDDGSIRRHFWEVVSELYEKNFFEAYSDWCRRHNLQFTGHVLLEEGLYFNTIFQGNIIKNLEHMDMPGVDHLCKVTEMPNMEFMVGNASHMPKVKTNMQCEKIAASAAHLSGKRRVISETYGVAGWDLSLADMKWIADWQYVLGINQLCPHAFFYSIEGFRKYDAPPSHIHNSTWKHYKVFADYIARLSYVLSQGIHKADVAVLYPLSSFQSVYIPGEQNEADKAISDVFDMLCAALPKVHYDYDIMPEHRLLDAVIDEGTIKVASETFKVLFVASVRGLSEAHLQKIRDFVKTGGQVVVFNGETIVDDSECINCGEYRSAYNVNVYGKGLVYTIAPLNLDADISEFERLLKSVLSDAIDADVIISGDNAQHVCYLHRMAEDEDLYFFVNTSNKSEAKVGILLKTDKNGIVVYDAETGQVKPMSGYMRQADRLYFEYQFAPCGSLMIGVNRVAAPTVSADISPVISTVEQHQQILPYDGWMFDIEGYNVLPLNCWDCSMQIDNSTARFQYTARFYAKDKVDELLLMLDDIEYRQAFMGLMDLAVYVNGIEVNGTMGYYIDKKFKTIDIRRYVIKGDNVITLSITHSAWSGQPHLLTSPAKLLGRFALESFNGGYSIKAMQKDIKLGPWTSFGYPFYSGTGIYSTEFMLEHGNEKQVDLILDELADCAEIYVNDQYAGLLVWKPWRLNIGPYVRMGKNKLTIKVTNTLINFIESKERPAGILGIIKIIIAQ